MNCGSSCLPLQVVYDRVTDRSRGFAFVTMGGVEEAKVAIQMFDGSVSSVKDDDNDDLFCAFHVAKIQLCY